MKDYNLIIKLGNNEPDATVVMESDGIKTQKVVSIDELASSLASTHKVSTGIIPRGTRYFSGANKNFNICIETAGRQRLFFADFYSKRELAQAQGLPFKPEQLTVPFPPLLFFFQIKGGKIRDTIVLAVKQTLSRETDQLYRFPFGNTSADGRVCWGNNKLPEIKTPMDLVAVMSTFLDAPFNGDLLDNRTVSPFNDGETKIKDFWELIRYVSGKEKFPEEALYPIGKFNSFIKEITNE